jgi:hypothetical protein
MQVTCCWCGAIYSVSFGKLRERQREAIRIFYRKDNGESYTDRRVFAADCWFNASRVVESWKSGHLAKEFKRKDGARQTSYRNEPKKKDRWVRARDEMKERACKFIRKMAQRERELYGPHKHDLARRVEHIENRLKPSDWLPKSYVRIGPDERAARVAIWKLVVMRLCERVIWGQGLPETSEAFRQALASVKAFEQERERLQREKEEAERKREEERKRQHEEYLARKSSQQSVKVQPVTAQLDKTAVDNDLKVLMGETAYNAMRQAENLANTNQITDTRERKRIELPHFSAEPESKPPPDDGTFRYQQKLAHWRKTGVWLPDDWM